MVLPSLYLYKKDVQSGVQAMANKNAKLDKVKMIIISNSISTEIHKISEIERADGYCIAQRRGGGNNNGNSTIAQAA